MKETKCGHQLYYSKGFCRSCYERDLRSRNPGFAERQCANTRQWIEKNHDRKLKVDRAYHKRICTPEYNERMKLKHYGLTVADYQQMLEAQGGVCAICGKAPGKKKLAIDHNHETGVIRGLLCFRCNYGLGWFQEDIEQIYKAIDHLENKHVTTSKLAPVKP